jgi:predicted nucleic acid-binding protein
MTGPSILVDTWAWIEMMMGSGQGDRVRTVIDNNPDLFVSILTIYELRYRIEQLMDDASAISIINQITEQVEVIPVDAEIALLAGAIKADQKKNGSSMGAVDCMILATARAHGLKILSGDKHFAGFEETLDITEPIASLALGSGRS